MKTILVIDSDSTTRTLAREILAKEGVADTIDAVDGHRGITEVRNHPELAGVLLSTNLPGLSGMDALIAIRKFRGTLPVILLADPSFQNQHLLALRRGANQVLNRPLRPEELLVAVNQAISTEQLQRRIEKQSRRMLLLEKSALELTTIAPEELAPQDAIRDDALLKKTIDLIAEVLDAKKVSLMLLDPERDELTMAQSNWLPVAKLSSMRTPLGRGPAGWVAQKGQPLLVKDTGKDDRFAGSGVNRQYSSPSFVCTPLFFQKKVVGVVCANERRDGEPFSEGDLATLNTFGHQVALAISGLSMAGRLELENAKLRVIRSLSEAVLAAVAPEQIFAAVTEKVRAELGVEAVVIFNLAETGDSLTVEAATGGRPMDEVKARQLAGGLVRKVLEGKSLLVTDLASPGVDPSRDFPPGFPPVSLAAVPLQVKGTPLGALAVYNLRDGTPLGRHQMEILEAVASISSMALKNAWLYQNLMRNIDEVVTANSRLEAAREELAARNRELSQLRKKVTP